MQVEKLYDLFVFDRALQFALHGGRLPVYLFEVAQKRRVGAAHQFDDKGREIVERNSFYLSRRDAAEYVAA